MGKLSHDAVERKPATGKGNQLGAEVLYIRSMGRAMQVSGVFLNDEDANHFCSKDRDGYRHGVVACPGSLILTAKLQGTKFEIKER